MSISEISMRDRAIRAWRGAASDEQNRQSVAQQMETAITACRRAAEWFGEVPHRVHICYHTMRPFVEYDTLRLYYAADGFRLKRICIHCGQTGYSPPFKTLKGLGEMVCDFRFASHKCINYAEGVR